MTALVDTSAFFALTDLDDEHHGRARQTYGELDEAGVDLLTTSHVVVETAQLIQRRLGLKHLRLFREGVLAASTVVWFDAALNEAAWDELEQIGRRSVSLVDCSSAVIARSLGVTDIFAFDPHFELWGLRLVG